MLDLDIDIQGLKEMEKALLEIGKEIGAKEATGIMTKAMREGAQEYQNAMINNAPESAFARLVKKKSGDKVQITPGFLKSRIKIRASTNNKGTQTKKFGKNVSSLVKVGVFKVPYAVQVEYGTRRTKANPFIRNAFTSQSPTVIKVINQRLAKRIQLDQRRIAKKHQAK
jgi:HK97 gp10 family phage protein